MKWKVIDTVACPNTGIVFSAISSFKMLKLIIWYDSNIILPPGATIEPYSSGMKINGLFKPVTLYYVTPFRKHFWKELKQKVHCPENRDTESPWCPSPVQCALKTCPYGKKMKASLH
ncbi:anti-adapter protein IraM [Pseudenterobacter timonensis]|uniref:Anti-adapter protein IraM n=1 Tax=Pseudenterobacter timonensis TaxID=1755099 RepID=A0AAE4IWH9_9ENTR|nr:anti-adapter protein IraM [Pseudenterobacter timonensis]MDR9892089.1 anti-adapter protein IraM [Pseudenterobacter timonensis]